MTTDLHARLLAEIERREGRLRPVFRKLPEEHRELAYLAALKAIVELHRNAGGGCHECEYDYPCASLRCVAEGIGVEA